MPAAVANSIDLGSKQSRIDLESSFFYEKGGHTKLFHEKGGQIFVITKSEVNGHLFHEKGGEKALRRLIGQLYLR